MLPILLSSSLLLSLSLLAVLGVRAVVPPRFLVAVLRVALFAAVAASAALVVDHQNTGDPAFCGVGSGCFAVRVSPITRQLGIPLPNVGLAAFTGLLAASLMARTRAHHARLAAVAAAGGAVAVVLLALQGFVIGAFCAWCVVVDVAALVAAVAASVLAWRARRTDSADLALAVQTGPAGSAAWGIAALAAIGLPFLWGRYPVIPPLPPEIAALQAPGKITVVGFTDFECPFCRSLHAEVEAAHATHGDRLRVVRKMAPLSHHPGALPAAKAYVCAPEAGRDRAAALLYHAPEGRLTDAGVAEVLRPLDLDAAAFKACLAAPSTQAEIDADTALFAKLEGRGLPFHFVGRRVVMGAGADRFRQALAGEAQGEQPALPLPLLFVALGALAAAAVAVSARSKPRPPPADQK